MDSSRILTGLSQYPVFKVQAQRGDTLPMSLPAVNCFSQPISELLARPSEMQNAPAFLAGGVGTVPMYQHCWSGPAIRSPSYNLVLSRRARLRCIGTSSFDKLPSPQGACKGVWKVLQKFFVREPVSRRSVRSDACPPAVRGPQVRSRTRRTHRGRGPPALRRSSPHLP